MELSKTASALGLYSYGKPAPDSKAFERFYSTAFALLESFGIAPTYIGVDGDGYPDDYRKFGSSSHQKLVNAGFIGIRGLLIAANPEGSDEPSYDSFVELSFGFMESMQEATLCFVVNESFVPFGSDAYDGAWKAFLDLNAWDFGYGFAGEVKKNPGLHILGADNGKLTANEQSALNAWYGSLPEERLECLRGIYPYNFVNTRQLEKEVMEGLILHQFIQQQQGLLTRLTDYGLHLWKLDESEIDHVREQLNDGAGLISA